MHIWHYCSHIHPTHDIIAHIYFAHDIIAHIHIAHMVLLHTWSKETVFTLYTQDIMHIQIAYIK